MPASPKRKKVARAANRARKANHHQWVATHAAREAVTLRDALVRWTSAKDHQGRSAVETLMGPRLRKNYSHDPHELSVEAKNDFDMDVTPGSTLKDTWSQFSET